MSWRLVWEPGVKTVKKFQAETLNFKVKTEDKTELKWSACPHFCMTLLSSSFRNFLIEFNSRKSSSYGLYHPDPGRYPFCVFQNKFMKEKKKKKEAQHQPYDWTIFPFNQVFDQQWITHI